MVALRFVVALILMCTASFGMGQYSDTVLVIDLKCRSSSVIAHRPEPNWSDNNQTTHSDEIIKKLPSKVVKEEREGSPNEEKNRARDKQLYDKLETYSYYYLIRLIVSKLLIHPLETYAMILQIVATDFIK